MRSALRHRFVPAASAAVALVLLLTLAPATTVARAAGRGEPGPIRQVRVELVRQDADVDELQQLGLLIDGVFDGWARVYVTDEELTKLRSHGFRATILPDDAPERARELERSGGVVPRTTDGRVPAAYHTYETLTSDLAQIAADHADIVRLTSIGTSVQGRQLWMVKISADPDADEDEPEVSFISSMHGDEVVGKELCFNLIDYLTAGYGTDPRATDLVDHSEIWIMPSMNPDGTFLGQRFNANGIDLNRNFPDQFDDPVDSPVGRQPETAAVMNWMLDRRLAIAANFHGGALVANYPFDGNAAGTSTYTPSPDNDEFVSIARTYADNNPPMAANNSVASFDNGITNGADWYVIYGGMQDWDYVWRGGFELTLEVSNVKWPAASTLPAFWDDNLESMLSYLERAQEGIRGIVTDAETGEPLAAAVRVDASPFPSYTDRDLGDYHRIVLPGPHDVHVSASGYAPVTVPGVVVAGGPAVRLDVALTPQPVDLQPVGDRVEDGGDGFLAPGETADLAVTLANSGRAATGVHARLIPTGWLADVTRAEAVYPDLPTAGSGESLAPYHQIALSPDVPAGHRAGFALAWESDQGSGTSEPFFVDTGLPTCSSFPGTGLPQTVSALITASSNVSVTDDVGVDEVHVGIEVRHPYIGDLTVTLTSPSGTHVILHNRGGGSADDIVGTYGVDLTPVEPLSVLAGESALGTWNLTVADADFTDNGTLEAWSLELCGRPAEAMPPEMRFRDAAKENGAARLRWWTYPGLASYRVYRASDPSSSASFVDVTAEDPDPTDTAFLDGGVAPVSFYLVTGVGPGGEGAKGHFGE